MIIGVETVQIGTTTVIFKLTSCFIIFIFSFKLIVANLYSMLSAYCLNIKVDSKDVRYCWLFFNIGSK